MESKDSIKVRSNYRVTLYTEYGTKVRQTVCGDCMMKTRRDRVERSHLGVTTKDCDRCGMPALTINF